MAWCSSDGGVSIMEGGAVALGGEAAWDGSPVSDVVAGVGGMLRSCGWRGVLCRVVLVRLSPAVAAKP